MRVRLSRPPFHLRKAFIIYVFILSGYSLQAQDIEPDSLYFITGHVLYSLDSSAIQNVHVLNLSKGTGTISTSSGSFVLNVREMDTLKFSCIGFQDYYILVNINLLRPDMLVLLKPDTVFMNEVRISPLPPRRFFPIAFMEIRVPNEKIPDLKIPGIWNIPGYTPPTGIIFTGPAQALYNLFNKKARTSRKLRKNRERYGPYLVPEGGDSLVFPERVR